MSRLLLFVCSFRSVRMHPDAFWSKKGWNGHTMIASKTKWQGRCKSILPLTKTIATASLGGHAIRAFDVVSRVADTRAYDSVEILKITRHSDSPVVFHSFRCFQIERRRVSKCRSTSVLLRFTKVRVSLTFSRTYMAWLVLASTYYEKRSEQH